MPPPENEEEYATLLIDYLLDLYYADALDAKKLCSICFYLSKSHIGEADRFALDPDSQTGKFQRKLDQALDWVTATDRFLKIDGIPSRDQKTGERE